MNKITIGAYMGANIGINTGLLTLTYQLLRRAIKTNQHTTQETAKLHIWMQQWEAQNDRIELYNESQRQQREHETQHHNIKEPGCAWCIGIAQ